MRYSNYMSATDLLEICDILEGEKIGKEGTYNSLYARLHNYIGIDFALKGDKLRNELIQNINNLMYINNENIMCYREF